MPPPLDSSQRFHKPIRLPKQHYLGRRAYFLTLCARDRAPYFRSKTGKTLWQISFFDHILRTAEDLSKTAEYILLNPVRAGLVKRPEDYPYSRIFSRSH